MKYVVAMLKSNFDLRHDVFKTIYAYRFKQEPYSENGNLKSIGWTVGPVSSAEADVLKNHLQSLGLTVNLVDL